MTTASRYFIKDGYRHRTENATVEQETGDYFTPKRAVFSRHMQHHVYALAGKLTREHGLRSVVDVGCGLGHKLVELVAPSAERVVGIDQPTVVQAAQRTAAGAPFVERVQFVAADLEKPDDGAVGTFDLVLSVDVIEHLLDPDKLLAFLRARCHRDSWVIVSTPERDVRRGPDCMMSPKAVHVREWNGAELKRYLEHSGFEVVEQHLLPAFKSGWSWTMLRERLRMVRKGIAMNYCQAAVCRVRPA